MTAERFEVYPASITKAGPIVVNFAQMTSHGLVTGAQHSRIRPASSLDGLAHILANAKPSIAISTADLETFWTHVSPSVGLALISPNGATLRLREREDCADFIALATATHMTFTAVKGCLLPLSYTASQDSNDPVAVQAVIHPHYDGTNLPIVVNNAVSFTGAPTPAFASAYYLGPVVVNGVEIKGVNQHGVDFGITYQTTPTSPGPYSHAGSIMDRNPSMTFTTRKKDEMANLGSIFAAAAGGAVDFYLQRGTAFSDRSARANSDHIKISCTAAMLSLQNDTNEAGQDALATYMVKPTGVVSVAINQAIPV